MTYPSSIDSFQNPSGTTLVDTGVDHAALHSAVNNTLTGVENTLGTTAGTSVLKNFVVGDFAARINSGGTLQQVLIGTIGTSMIAGGTVGTAVFSSPTVVVGSDAQGDVYYRSSGGSIARLAVGTNGQFLTTNGTTPSWGTLTAGSGGTFAIGTLSRDLSTSSGNATVVVPFAPSLVTFDYAENQGKMAGHGAHYPAGPTSYSFFIASATGYVTGDMATGYALYFSNQTGTNNQGSITSVTGGSIVIAFTKTGSPTGTVNIILQAFK